jgi:hypothetical protein
MPKDAVAIRKYATPISGLHPDNIVVDNIATYQIEDSLQPPPDIILGEAQRKTIDMVLAKLLRLQRYVGYGNFNIIGWDQSLQMAASRAQIGVFLKVELESIANQAIGIANSSTRSARESFRLKNTRTREGDKEMEKPLTCFATKNGKPAMGVEASRSYRTERRIQNHLRFVEAIFDRIGIGFRRDFDLSAETIKHKPSQDIRPAMFNKQDTLRF